MHPIRRDSNSVQDLARGGFGNLGNELKCADSLVASNVLGNMVHNRLLIGMMARLENDECLW